MNRVNRLRAYNTLRGFLTGEEPNEDIYFAYKATLRLSGDVENLDEISERLGLEPTHVHRKGDKMGPRSPGFPHDMWAYAAPIPETEPLEKHIDALWTKIESHKQYLLSLKKTLQVDVFLGYRSNCDHAGIEVPHTCLEMFTELQIPFGVSIIIA
jgi:hypothetical protein